MAELNIVEKILNKEEGQTFECKRALKKPSDALVTICAFANADGGIFVYGLGDPERFSGKERLVGVSEAKDHCDELLKLIANNFIPPLPKVNSHYLDIVNKEGLKDKILLIDINASRAVHSLHSGRTYIRRGRQNNSLTHDQSMQLQYEKGIVTFESELAKGVNLRQLDQKLTEEFMVFNKSKEKDALKFFVKNGLAEQEDGKICMNNAVVLLFADNPFVLLKRKCSIAITHYFGIKQTPSSKPNFRRPPFIIRGPLLKQIEEAYEYVSENALPIKLEGATFKRLKIPNFVIQEAITNAVIHRDYSIQNDIHIRIFDNRLEIESPGWFPGLVTLETILNDRFARNPIIEDILRRMPNPPNLNIGEGVNRMFNEMEKKNLYVPLYSPRKYTPHSVCVVLFNEEKVTYWNVVDKYLSEHEVITNSEFREITGLDTLKASEFLKKWTKQQLLEKIGDSKRKTAYKKPSSEKGGSSRLLGDLF